MKNIKKVFREHYTILLGLIGIMGSAVFAIIGYIVAGAIDSEENVGYLQSLIGVLKNPFSNHYNTYTPIIIGIFFFVYEFLYFLVLVSLVPKIMREERMNGEVSVSEEQLAKKRQKMLKEKVKKSEDIESETESDSEVKNSKENVSLDDILGLQDAVVQASLPLSKEEVDTDEDDLTEDDASEFEIKAPFTELFALNYSREQIREISRIQNYMDNIEVDDIVKMFQKNMSPSEIHDYIELFYE